MNLQKSMRDGRNKDVVKYRFRMYLKEYEAGEEQADAATKSRHRSLQLDYYRYMMGSAEK